MLPLEYPRAYSLSNYTCTWGGQGTRRETEEKESTSERKEEKTIFTRIPRYAAPHAFSNNPVDRFKTTIPKNNPLPRVRTRPIEQLSSVSYNSFIHFFTYAVDKAFTSRINLYSNTLNRTFNEPNFIIQLFEYVFECVCTRIL